MVYRAFPFLFSTCCVALLYSMNFTEQADSTRSIIRNAFSASCCRLLKAQIIDTVKVCDASKDE